MRLRTYWIAILGMSTACWLFLDSATFAATAKVAVSSPNLWDRAVNSIGYLINWVAQYVGHPKPDYGLALLIVTLAIRLLTVPLMLKSLRNTKKIQALQPQLAEIKKQTGKDPKKYQEQMMALYKTENVNPLAGCMPMLLQMVILMVLYRAIYTDQAMLQSTFLGIHLGVPDHTFILPVLAGVTSYLQQKVSMVTTDPSQKMLMYIFPVMIFFLSTRYLAALALYWVFSNIFTIVQMSIIKTKPGNSGGVMVREKS